jgi:hypothetical protein
MVKRKDCNDGYAKINRGPQDFPFHVLSPSHHENDRQNDQAATCRKQKKKRNQKPLGVTLRLLVGLAYQVVKMLSHSARLHPYRLYLPSNECPRLFLTRNKVLVGLPTIDLAQIGLLVGIALSHLALYERQGLIVAQSRFQNLSVPRNFLEDSILIVFSDVVVEIGRHIGSPFKILTRLLAPATLVRVAHDLKRPPALRAYFARPQPQRAVHVSPHSDFDPVPRRQLLSAKQRNGI